ncbi:myotubularin-related protein 12 isoform X6 [Ochotona curzoniae]|uniref:myotubularin-related protein 12 isoform X6 n=1 Tax=Ochotona curzoniae TaxID=130825 RepID=UPI001B34DB7D|nr:myotubularin-related protein 12 isoform X6 [Ochotona curzoniae]
MLGKGGVGGGGGTRAPKPSFVSYVRPEEIHTNEKEVAEKEVALHLLPGEQLLCEASTVLKYVQEDSCQRGVYGRLVCTDFKISFLGDDESTLDSAETHFKNKIIGENDITLHCVDQIYGVFDEKKKTLFGQLKKYPEKLIIHCKDLRVFHFCLRYTKEEEVKRIVSGIIHHTQAPKLLKRLFLFSYATAAQNIIAASPKNHTVMFDTLKDWCWELERTKGNVKYKAVSVNEGYKICDRLPAYFVVPTPLPEENVRRFQGRGIPIWCWSCHNGSSLLKMSALPKEQDDGILQIQKSFLDGIYKTIHRPPYEIVKTEDLSNNFLPLQEIQAAYSKFKQLFLIDNSTEFWDTDIKWFSLLESSSWFDIIRRCLKKAIEITEYLEAQNMNVLLLEENASDLCCLVSSLVQVMMDPHCRTRAGFQSLIQKEWIMGGHCFLDRCNHLRQSEKEEHRRQLSLPLTQSKSSPKRGFFREETDHLIKNLLGKRISKLINSSDELQDNFREFYDSWHSKPTDYHGLLLPRIEGPEIKVWAQRYLRWIPEAQIAGGGRVATMSKLFEMMEEVQSLQEKLNERCHPQEPLQTETPCLLRNSARLSSLFPFALLQRHSSKPILPTSSWKTLGDEEDLAKREDEFVDLGDV